MNAPAKLIAADAIDFALDDLEWRQLDWLPDYEVSEFAHVRRIRQVRSHVAGLVLTGKRHPLGYIKYTLRINGTPRYTAGSRLVCEAWHGPPPQADSQAAHNDGNPWNNHYSNLRWATPKENTADKVRHGTSQRGERSANARLTENFVRQLRISPLQNKDIRRLLGPSFSKAVIQAARCGHNWRHVEMNPSPDFVPDMSFFPAWPARYQFYAASGVKSWLDACIHSIRDEAETAADRGWRMACQVALDTGDHSEILFLIYQSAREEALADRAYRFEVRTGREWNEFTPVRGEAA